MHVVSREVGQAHGHRHHGEAPVVRDAMGAREKPGLLRGGMAERHQIHPAGLPYRIVTGTHRHVADHDLAAIVLQRRKRHADMLGPDGVPDRQPRVPKHPRPHPPAIVCEARLDGAHFNHGNGAFGRQGTPLLVQPGPVQSSCLREVERVEEPGHSARDPGRLRPPEVQDCVPGPEPVHDSHALVANHLKTWRLRRRRRDGASKKHQGEKKCDRPHAAPLVRVPPRGRLSWRVLCLTPKSDKRPQNVQWHRNVRLEEENEGGTRRPGGKAFGSGAAGRSATTTMAPVSR